MITSFTAGFDDLNHLVKTKNKRIKSSKDRNKPVAKVDRMIDPEGDPTSLFKGPIKMPSMLHLLAEGAKFFPKNED